MPEQTIQQQAPIAQQAASYSVPNTTEQNGNMSTEDILAISSLIVAVITLPSLCCGGIFCAPFQIISIGLGIFGLKSAKYKGLAIAGISVGSIALVLNIVLIVISLLFNLSLLSISSISK
jgi:hypothetical protein